MLSIYVYVCLSHSYTCEKINSRKLLYFYLVVII